MKLDNISTSTIGSFPLEDSIANRKRCLDDLISIGINYPAYPQLVDMGKQFLDDIATQNGGITFEQGRYKIKSKKIETGLPHPGLEPLFWTTERLKLTNKKEKIRLKAPITGPFTLASYIETGSGVFPFNTAVSNSELIQQLTREISKSCHAASKEVAMVSIDEPVLGVVVGAKTAFGYTDEDIIEAYNVLRNACGNRIVGTHICGRISPKLADILLRTDLDFISHEFHDMPKNAAVYSPEKVEANNKILSVGCLSTKNLDVESPEQILEVMKRFDDYGTNLIFTPDCGFKKLLAKNLGPEEAYQISIKKLSNMVKAEETFARSK